MQKKAADFEVILEKFDSIEAMNAAPSNVLETSKKKTSLMLEFANLLRAGVGLPPLQNTGSENAQQ